MFKLAFVQLRTQFRRTLAVAIAVVLGVAFFTASMMSGAVIRESLRNEVGNQLRGADLVILTDAGSVDTSVEAVLAGIAGIRESEAVPVSYGLVTAGGTNTVLRLGPVTQLPELLDQMPLNVGRLPDSFDEIALTEGAASSLGVEIDDSVTWTPFAEEQEVLTEFRVVGLVSGGNAFGTSLTEAFVVPDAFDSVAPAPILTAIVAQVADGFAVEDVQSRVADVLPTGNDVLTFDEMVNAEVASMEQGSNVLAYGLSAFSLIALFVAAIVISNTFSITVAQRTHDLAMLRCIGAEKRQLHRSVIIEAAVLGLISSIAGVLLGYGTISAGSALLIDASNGVALADLSPVSFIAPVLTGTLVTIVSAVMPARSATAIHPLQALRRSDAPGDTGSLSIARVAITLVLIVGGGVLLLGGMMLSLRLEDNAPFGPLLIGMAGGAVSFVGLLLASPFVLPLGVRAAGGVSSAVFGVPARLAASNATRNPRRTAVTASALMMGVTLITMMTVGAATVQATLNDVVDRQAPIDLEIRQSGAGSDRFMPGAVYDSITSVDGVRNAAPIQIESVELRAPGGEIDTSAVAIDPDQARAVTRFRAVFEGFGNGVVVVPGDIAQASGIGEGDDVLLVLGERELQASAHVASLASWDIYITPHDMSLLAPEAPVRGAWMRLDDNASVKRVVRDISDAMPAGDSVSVQGGASDRAAMLGLVDQMLLIATALLAVAVIIAIIGVGNTLTLSVLERTRESGMLRALGLTSGQLRETLAIEGALISLVGGVVGIVAGAVYGWIGAITLFGSSWTVTPGFPGMRMLLILIIAVGAGVLASVIPGRRAAAIAPVEALATI